MTAARLPKTKGMVAAADGKSNARLDVLDGLRGIAMLLVLWFHVWQQGWVRADVPFFGRTLNFNWVPETGFIGLDLFFFISGFCLFYPYAGTLFDGRRLQSNAEFAWHRARKILPSYVVAIGLFFAIGYAHFDTWTEALRQIALHLAFMHTWFADSYGSISGVLWSLGVEVQFYLMFPLLCRAALRRPWVTFGAMFAVALGYRIGAQALAGDSLRLFISQVFGVLDLFGAGMAAAYLHRWLAVRRPSLAGRRRLWTIVALVGACLAARLSVDLFDHRALHYWADNWYVWGRTALALSFIGLTVGSLFAARWWRAAIANPAFAFISVISYNLYLWHTVVMDYVRTLPIFPWHGHMPPQDNPSAGLAFELTAIVLAIAVAVIPTYLIERPLLRLPLPGRKHSLSPAPAAARVRS